MKVPTYQTQGTITAKVGATQMSVQANPAALTQGAKAFTELAGTVAKEGLTWYEQELKAERASKLAAKENELTTYLQNQQVLAKTTAQSDPVKALKEYTKNTNLMRNKLAGNIDDSIVKKRFLSSATTDILNKRSSVLQTVRNSQIDIGKAHIIQRTSQLERTIATGNSSEVAKAKQELFGIEITPGRFVGGLHASAVSAGYYTNVEGTNLTLRSKGNVDRLTVRQEITSAAISNKPDHALQVLQKVSNPKNYPNLRPEDRNNLIKEANNLVGMLTRREISLEKSNQTKAKKDLTIKQSNNFDDFLTSFIESNKPNSTVTAPTTNSILESFKNAGIDDKQFGVLNDLILGKDAPISDATVVVDFYERLALAQNNDQIIAIMKEVQNKIGPDGSVMLGDATAIIKTAKGYLAGSTETKETQRYASILKTAIGDSPGGVSVAGFKQQSSMGLRRADALATYYALVGEGLTSPIEAYKQVASMYADNLSNEMGFLAPTSMLMKSVGKADINDWNINDITKANQYINDNPIDPRTNKKTYTPLEVALEKETIGLVKDFLKTKGKLDPIIPNNDEESNNGEVSYLDKLLKMIKPNEEDSIRNPN